jgi:hypothetical protein
VQVWQQHASFFCLFYYRSFFTSVFFAWGITT